MESELTWAHILDCKMKARRSETLTRIKLWKVVGNIQLYETDGYCIHLHSNVVPVILLSILITIEKCLKVNMSG